MTSTGALPRALAAARPPKPPPTITTRGVFHVCASAPLIELRLASFIHPFLKLLRPEISENLDFLADRDGQVSGEQTAALSSEPEADQQNQDKRGHTEPGDHNDFDPHFANGRNIVVDVRISVKESVTIAKDVGAASQVDEEEKCRGDSQSRKCYGINQSEHISIGAIIFRSEAIRVCLIHAGPGPC